MCGFPCGAGALSMSKLLVVLLTLGAMISYFSAANSAMGYLTYGKQLEVYDLLVPDASLIIPRDGEGRVKKSVKDPDASASYEVEYLLVTIEETQERLLTVLENAQHQALRESLAWLVMSLILTVTLLIFGCMSKDRSKSS